MLLIVFQQICTACQHGNSIFSVFIKLLNIFLKSKVIGDGEIIAVYFSDLVS